jgi:hypothetical protein
LGLKSHKPELAGETIGIGIPDLALPWRFFNLNQFIAVARRATAGFA